MHVFLSLIIGFWFGSFGGNIPGEEFINKIIIDNPDTYVIFGLPLIGILGIIFYYGIISILWRKNWQMGFEYCLWSYTNKIEGTINRDGGVAKLIYSEQKVY